MDVIRKHDRATETEKRKRQTKPQPKQIVETPDKDKLPDAKKLRKKLQKFSEKNESLSKVITDKNKEIADLKRSVQSLNDVLNSVPIDELRCNSSIASTKLLELSKKNRQLRAELETAKNRSSKKEIEIQKLQRELKASEEKYQQDLDMLGKGNFTPIEEMQGKISSLQQKLFESRNKVVELNTQLKLAQKCLHQEVGESVNLNTLAAQSTGSNWRGRAQQILHLQQKVNELKERLEMYDQYTNGRIASIPCPPLEPAQPGSAKGSIASTQKSHSSKMPSVNMLTSGGRHNSSGNIKTIATFDRFAPGVRKSEIIHRAKVEAMEKEMEELRAQLVEQRHKILALKVRNKTLSEDIVKYKMKSNSLEQQTGFNGMNFNTMNEKLTMQKYEFENRLEEFRRKLTESEKQRSQTQLQADEFRSKLQNTEAIVKCKDEYIKEQSGLISKLEEDLKAICGDFLFSCRELRKEEFISILDSLETEKNQLVEYTKVITERIEKERKKNENLTEQMSKQKLRISRMENKTRELEKELDLQTERKKRTQRIADYANSIHSQTLSGSLNSFVFENSSTIPATASENTDRAPLVTEELTQAQVVDMKNQLEYATEKIALLEEKIAYLAEEKDNDSKAFQDIIGNSRGLMLETIISHRTVQNNTNVPVPVLEIS